MFARSRSPVTRYLLTAEMYTILFLQQRMIIFAYIHTYGAVYFTCMLTKASKIGEQTLHQQDKNKNIMIK